MYIFKELYINILETFMGAFYIKIIFVVSSVSRSILGMPTFHWVSDFIEYIPAPMKWTARFNVGIPRMDLNTEEIREINKNKK